MDILLYNDKLKLAIGQGPSFPELDTLKEKELPEEECSVNEWQTYFIKCYSDTLPEGFDPTRLPEPSMPIPLPKDTYAFNFKNYTGWSRIGPIRLHIINNKIGDEAYHGMLDYIADRYVDLVFSFSASKVGQNYSPSGSLGRNIPYIEYLFLKKFLMDPQEGLSAISSAITTDPHKHLCREYVKRSIEAIRFVDPVRLMDALTSGQNMAALPEGHLLLETPMAAAIRQVCNQRLFPTEMREEQKRLSLDTPENRFVKHFLEDTRKRLEDLKKAFTPKSTYLNPDLSENLERMSFQVNDFLDHPMWLSVGRMAFLPENSQVLQRREGYRQLFRLFSLLQLLTRYEFPDAIDIESLLETKDVATLYEYWCFFLVKAVLDRRGRSIVNVEKIRHESHTETTLAEGCRIEYDNGIHLLFNWTAPNDESYSLSYRPDIVIAIGKKKLILDAKYKGRSSERGDFYGNAENGTIVSWKDEDIGKMHTYREAIRNVFGAFALYPGTEEEMYNTFDSESDFEGVGALPLKPDKKGICGTGDFDRLCNAINEFIKFCST